MDIGSIMAWADSEIGEEIAVSFLEQSDCEDIWYYDLVDMKVYFEGKKYIIAVTKLRKKIDLETIVERRKIFEENGLREYRKDITKRKASKYWDEVFVAKFLFVILRSRAFKESSSYLVLLKEYHLYFYSIFIFFSYQACIENQKNSQPYPICVL